MRCRARAILILIGLLRPACGTEVEATIIALLCDADASFLPVMGE
jgi:hypothetical protein